jgi:peptidoglycan-associated lipoprotein
MKKFLITILAVSLVNLLVACASEKQKEPVAETKPVPAAIASKPVTPVVAPVASPALIISTPVAVDPLNDPGSILAKRSVYYPFDVSVLQDNDKPGVDAHAKYLSEHANRKVRLEGNCDERGSAEYNLALGQRRADGVKKMLVVGGVKDSQIETVSFGNEKPKLVCHEEKCWKENRRTDMNYSAF